MARPKKVTWDDIYKDFRSRHPRYAKKCLGFKPHDYATILLMFPNRERATYNYDTQEVKKLRKSDF